MKKYLILLFSLILLLIIPQSEISAHGSSLWFDGVDQYVSVGGTFPTGASPRTIHFWTSVDVFDDGNNDCFIGYQVSGVDGRDFFISPEDSAVSITFSGHRAITPKGGLKKYKWYCIDIVVPNDASSTDDVEIYIGNRIQALTDEGGSAKILNTQFTGIDIGSPHGTARYFDGYLDDVQFYSREVDSTEREWLMNHPEHIYNTDNLIGWWKFNEFTGIIAGDSSGQGNDGDLINSPIWSIQTPQTAGKATHGSSLEFVGASSQYVNCGTENSLDFTTNNFTIEFRLYRFGVGSIAYIQYGSWNNGYALINIFNKVGWRLGDGTMRDFLWNDAELLDTWLYYVGTVNRVTDLTELWVESISQGTKDISATSGSLTNPTGTFYIGSWVGISWFMRGYMDEIRIYTRVLDPTEIAWNYRHPSVPYNTDGLVGWWKFNEFTGIVAGDSSGQGNDGDLINNPTWSIQTPIGVAQ